VFTRPNIELLLPPTITALHTPDPSLAPISLKLPPPIALLILKEDVLQILLLAPLIITELQVHCIVEQCAKAPE
jgi:hypothetical protein